MLTSGRAHFECTLHGGDEVRSLKTDHFVVTSDLPPEDHRAQAERLAASLLSERAQPAALEEMKKLRDRVATCGAKERHWTNRGHSLNMFIEHA